MRKAELILTALAELSTRQVAESKNATGLEENKKASEVGEKNREECSGRTRIKNRKEGCHFRKCSSTSKNKKMRARRRRKSLKHLSSPVLL